LDVASRGANTTEEQQKDAPQEDGQ